MPSDSADNSSRRGVPQLVPTGDQKGKPPILLNRPVFQMGARESCRIRLVSSTVSQVHALLVQTRHLTYIRDLASRNGVFVNGEKVREAALHEGDRLKVGRFEFVYRGPKRPIGDEPPALPATLEITGSPIPVPIEERVVLIGRRRTSDVPLLEESVSNAHAVLFQWEGKRFCRDLGSRTHTFVNGRKIHERELAPGDVIKVGETEIRYTPSTEIASVDVVDSATDSQIAFAPSAEEVVADLTTPLAAASQQVAVSNLADTIGDIDITEDPSHHDTAMIPLSLQSPNPADTSSGDHGLELVPDPPVSEEPMARSWREASTNDLLPLTVEEVPKQPEVRIESIAEDETTDLGLTSHLAELSPIHAPIDPLQLTPADEPKTQEGNATIDLSNVDFDTSVAHTQEVDLPDDAERPLIAHQDLLEPETFADDTLNDTLAGETIAPVETPTSFEAETPVETELAAAFEDDRIEVIDATEPTPESALEIPVATDDTISVVEPETLSDTSFGRQVEDFTSPATTGDIVEPLPAEEASPAAPVLDLSLPLIPPLKSKEEVVAAAVEPEESVLEESIELPADAPIDDVVEAAEPDQAVPLIDIEPEPVELTAEISQPPVEEAVELAPAEPQPEAEMNLAPPAVKPEVDLSSLEAETPSESPMIEEPIAAVEPIEPEPASPAVEAPIELPPLEPEVSELETPVDLVDTASEASPVLEAGPEETSAVPEPLDLPSLDDLAMEALSSADVPFVEAQPPEDPVFGSSIAAPVDFTDELRISDEPVAQEGNATLAPPPETPAEAMELTAQAELPVPLDHADLIAPPIQPLEPDLPEVDLGLEPLPELAVDSVITPPPEFTQPPIVETVSTPPLSSDDAGIAASLTGGASTIAPASLSDLGSADAINDPFDMPSLVVPVPPRPLKKRRDRDKQTVIRNFGKDAESDAPSDEPAELPFATAKPGEEAVIGFGTGDGSVDVFGAASPENAEGLLASLEEKIGGKVEEDLAPQKSRRRRGRDGIAPRTSLQPVTETGPTLRPTVTYGETSLGAAEAEAKRRRILRSMIPVSIIGVLLAAGVWFAAWKFIPVIYEIQASLKFDNLAASDLKTQNVFREQQLSNLRNEATRRGALLMLRDRFPQIDAGFLDDPDRYYKAINNASWSNQTAGLLQLRYSGTDRSDDTARMLAVSLALYRANGDLVLRSRDAERNFRDISKVIARTETDIASLTEQIEKNRLTIERYQSEKLTAANIQLQNLDKAYQDAFAALKGAQAELDRLKKTSPAAPGTQPGEGASVQDDAELAALAKKTDDLAAKLTQARAERAELAQQARESLDAAYQQFQKQIEASQGAMQQSPELARFVETAQSQMKIIREMVDDFIGAQQKDFQQLAEWKARLDEKMQSRRSDLWAKDEQLQELAGQREITIRKLNAAKSDNLDKEIESISSELTLIETSIKARQDVLATDPMYAEIILPLQQMIEAKQKDLAENRKKADDKLNTLQKQFAASLPTVEKLPAEQQVLAAEMKRRLGEIDAARRQYASAADQASVENDVVIKSMAQQLALLHGDMEIRKQQILAAQNGVAMKQLTEQIAQKEKEVADLTAVKDKAEQAFFAGQALVRELTTARAEAEVALNERYEAQQRKSLLEQQLEQAKRDVVTKKKSVDEAITPLEPTLSDVLVLRENDKRLTSAIGAGSGVLVITALLIVYLAFAAARANPFAHHTAETEQENNEQEENHPAVV